jgi:hypothetical protein
MALSNYKPTPAPGQQNEGIMSRIPWWGWVAGVGVIVVLFLVMRSGSNNNTTTQPGATSDNTQQLSDLESSLQQLLAQSGQSSSGLGGGGAGDGLTSLGSNPTAGLNPLAGLTSPGNTTVLVNPDNPAPAPAGSAATAVATNFGPSTRTAWTPPPGPQNPTSELIRTPITQPAPAPVITNPTPAQVPLTTASQPVTTASQPGSAQATMQGHIAVYQNIVAQGGTLSPTQAAALKTDIATYERQYGALSGASQPVMVKSTVNNTPGEPVTPSMIQGSTTGDASQAAARLKTLGYSTTTGPSTINPTPTVNASKTSSTSFVQQTGGNVKKAV